MSKLEMEELSPEHKRQFDELLKSSKAKLCPELKACIHRSGEFVFVKHKFVNVPYMPSMNGHLNGMFEQKSKAAQKALDNKQYKTYVWMHERPWRFDAFMEVKDLLSDEDYWSELGELWVDSDNIWQNSEGWRSLLSSTRPKREFFMNESERAYFDTLPDTFTIHRGYDPRRIRYNKEGLPFTLDRKKAEWFSNRFYDGPPQVVTKTITKDQAFAYKAREREIIYIPTQDEKQ